MRSLLFILTSILFLSVQFRAELRTVFGVRIAYQSTGQMVTLMACFTDGKMLTNRKILSTKEFIHYASGDWPSIYNRNRVDLFKLNEVAGGIYIDSITGEKIPFCFALEDLWKLRYSHSPLKGGKDEGWSQDDYMPSKQQQVFLKQEYGLENINTYFIIDTSFWKILRDVGDLDWIDKYQNLQPIEE